MFKKLSLLVQMQRTLCFFSRIFFPLEGCWRRQNASIIPPVSTVSFVSTGQFSVPGPPAYLLGGRTEFHSALSPSVSVTCVVEAT